MPLVALALVVLTALSVPITPAFEASAPATLAAVVGDPFVQAQPQSDPDRLESTRSAAVSSRRTATNTTQGNHPEPVAVSTTAVDCDPEHHGRFCSDGESGDSATGFLARLLKALAPKVPLPTGEPGERSCVTTPHDPIGSLQVVHGTSKNPEIGRVWTFRVEVEEGLGVDGTCFAVEALHILNDPRGWGADGDMSFQWVDGDDYDFRLILASPDTTDALCLPLRTGGIFSCRNGERVVLNQQRWEEGAPPFGDNTTLYRQYLVNHEVGHRLGHGHRTCPTPGAPAPIMMQQTKGVGGCVPTGWPLDSER